LEPPFSTLGLDHFHFLGIVFHGGEHSRRRPGQPDRRPVVPGCLFCFPGAAGGGNYDRI
jgi:hypothetical protein